MRKITGRECLKVCQAQEVSPVTAQCPSVEAASPQDVRNQNGESREEGDTL